MISFLQVCQYHVSKPRKLTWPDVNGPVDRGFNAPPPYSACVGELNDTTESIRNSAVNAENDSSLPLQLESRIPIAHEAEVLKLLLKSGGVNIAQIANSDCTGDEHRTHIASIRFSCGRHVKYVLTRVNDNTVIVGTWFEPVYGKIHLQKAVRNFFNALSWPASRMKTTREVHQEEFHSHLTPDFQHILVQPPPLKRWTWERTAHLCSSCELLRDGC